MQENGDLYRLKVKWWKQKRGGGRCHMTAVKGAEVRLSSHTGPGARPGQPGRHLRGDLLRGGPRLRGLRGGAAVCHIPGAHCLIMDMEHGQLRGLATLLAVSTLLNEI